jgi:hypothetical protein
MAHFEWMTDENPKDGVIPKVLDRVRCHSQRSKDFKVLSLF